MPRAHRSDHRFDYVVVANRLPVDFDRDPDGAAVWKRSPGGLVTALEPVLRSESGAWIGWPGIADHDVAPFVHDGLHVHPVPLSADELADYYEGFSNTTLWPLYHDAVKPPTFERRWWSAYTTVNERFAQAAAEVAAPNGTVWVQDYQLQLVPQMLRELRPDVTFGFFLHIPFPPSEIFMQLPWRRSVIEGLLGADLVGFQLPGGVENFCGIVNGLLGLPTTTTAEGVAEIITQGRTVRVAAFPIAADSADLATQARGDAVRERARQIRHDLGDPEKILLGVDRLDYTKGIGLRLDAVGEMFDEGRLEPGRHVMVQIATPSREQVDQYVQMRTDIETKVGHINGEHGDLGTTAVHYLYQGIDRDELIALFVAADLMVVTPLRDGMNLVAKEYVACHPDGGGALVLSEFAGAAAELVQAYLVNPHDVDMVKDTIAAALGATPAEREARMGELHAQVMSHNVHDWAHSFLDTLVAAAHSRAGGEGEPHSGPTSPETLGLDDLAERVSELARSHARSVATAESLTAGRISCLLGAAPESSTWYRGSIVAYASAVKHSLLEVSLGPVVSADAAREMAEHAAELLGADTVVAVTGAGGPDPQDGQAPGTVWFAVFDRGSVSAEKRLFDASPAGVVESTTRHALELLAAACAADNNLR